MTEIANGRPSAIECIRDRGLAEAFQSFVIDDPEIGVLIERAGVRDRFEGGRSPLGWSIDYHWPLGQTARDFAYRLARGNLLLIIEEAPPIPSREVVALSEAVTGRIGVLRDLLISGEIQAIGLTASWSESPVPARLWARNNLSIDVANGDLCEEDDRGNYTPIWTSVELRAPPTRAGHPGPPSKPAATRQRSPEGREVEGILRRKDIDVGLLGRKAAAAEVARDMKSPPISESETKALEAMVWRIWEAIKKTP